MPAQDLRAKIAEINNNTNRIGATVTVIAERLRLLSEQVAAGLSPADLQIVSEELANLATFSDTVATNLEGIAANPDEEPEPVVPEDVPEVTP